MVIVVHSSFSSPPQDVRGPPSSPPQEVRGPFSSPPQEVRGLFSSPPQAVRGPSLLPPSGSEGAATASALLPASSPPATTPPQDGGPGPASARVETPSPQLRRRGRRRSRSRGSSSSSEKKPKRARITRFDRHIPSNELAHDGRYERKINSSAKPKRKINLNKPTLRRRKRKHNSQQPITSFFNTYNSAREAQLTNSNGPSKRPRHNADFTPRTSNIPAPKGSDCLGANFPT